MKKIAILTGPTASGKSAIALQFASEISNRSIEIINADSMLVYREMDIGTAKPTPQELALIPHHLINIRNPDEPFTAGDFFRAVNESIADIESRGKNALIVGGTGFYLKALLYGMWDAPPADPVLRETLNHISDSELFCRVSEKDPATAQRIGPQDRYRLIRAIEMMMHTGKTVSDLEGTSRKDPDPRFELLIIDRSNDDLFSRISARTQQMLKDGFVDEVRNLEARYPRARSLAAVGYAQVCDHLANRLPQGRKIKPGIEGLREEIELATRQLVKRQRTWFRSVQHALNFQLPTDDNPLLEKLGEIYQTEFQ